MMQLLDVGDNGNTSIMQRNGLDSTLIHSQLNIKKMKKVASNLNPKSNPITTIFGAILFIIGLTLLLMPLILTPRAVLPTYVIWIFLVVGFGLILAPDSILTVFTKVVNKKSAQI
jgi:hypothetical protein